MLALVNAAWLHDLAGDHDHDHDDAPALVCWAHTGGHTAPVVFVSPGLPVLVSYDLPRLVSVALPLVRRALPPARAPSFCPAPPRAPPVA